MSVNLIRHTLAASEEKTNLTNGLRRIIPFAHSNKMKHIREQRSFFAAFFSTSTHE